MFDVNERRCLRHTQISGKVPCGYVGRAIDLGMTSNEPAICGATYATTAFCQDSFLGNDAMMANANCGVACEAGAVTTLAFAKYRAWPTAICVP